MEMNFLTTLRQKVCWILYGPELKNGLQQRQRTSIDERAYYVRQASIPPDCLKQRAGSALPMRSNNY